MTDADESNLYSSADVAKIFRVDVKTVGRWADRGEFEKRGIKIQYTIGGHRRFFKDEIHKLFQLMLEGRLYEDDPRNTTGRAGRIDDLREEDSGDSESE